MTRGTEWDDALDSAPGATFFHTSAWLVLTETVFNLKPRHVAVEDCGKIVLAMPLFFDGLSLHSPYIVDYGGPADTCRSKTIRDALQEKLVENVGGLKPAALYSRGHYSADTDLTLSKKSLVEVINEHVCYVLDDFYDRNLQDYFHKKKRTATKSALKKGIDVEQIALDDEKAVASYRRMHAAVKESQQSAPMPTTFFENIKSLPMDSIRIYMVREKTEYIAGLLVFKHNRTLYVFDNCSDGDYLDRNPNDLVYYQMLLDAQRERLSVDFGRTSESDTELCRFKERFGAKAYRMQTRREIFPPVSVNKLRLGIKKIVGKIKS